MEQIKGVIYKIIPTVENIDDGDVYYGSFSKGDINIRLSEHKSRYKRYINNTSTDYCHTFKLFEKYSIENCTIELVENTLYNNADDLKWKEREYIENNNCVNKNKPITTENEKKENSKEYNKQYYDNNREYYQEHNKQYRTDHKQEISDREKTKYNCTICKIYINQYYKSRHEQSQKHLDILNNVIKLEMDKYIYCESCDLDISRNHIARHNATPKHLLNVKILNGEIDGDVVIDLKCHTCDITFASISSRNRHFKSKKHLGQ
jgi:hypothetical protein